MIKIDLINARKIFEQEVEKQMLEAVMSRPESEACKIVDSIKMKVTHTDEVISDGLKVACELGFNDSFKNFAHVALMDHDIGRFAQIKCIGSFQDHVLFQQTGIKNHGVLGAQRLEEIIDEQLPGAVCFHTPIMKIVNDHVDKVNSNEHLSILTTSLFKNYSVEELLNKPGIKNSVISVITQMVQDVDRLDIFHQILDGRWEPMKVEDNIDPLVFQMFYNGEYLDMAELRKLGLWNANVGELVRLGFINQIKLLSVAKVVQKDSIIMKLKDKRQNPKVNDAFEYTLKKLEKRINNTPDGVILGE